MLEVCSAARTRLYNSSRGRFTYASVRDRPTRCSDTDMPTVSHRGSGAVRGTQTSRTVVETHGLASCYGFLVVYRGRIFFTLTRDGACLSLAHEKRAAAIESLQRALTAAALARCGKSRTRRCHGTQAHVAGALAHTALKLDFVTISVCQHPCPVCESYCWGVLPACAVTIFRFKFKFVLGAFPLFMPTRPGIVSQGMQDVIWLAHTSFGPLR